MKRRSQTPEEKGLTLPPSPVESITTPAAPITSQTPQFPKRDDEIEVRPIVGSNSSETLYISPPSASANQKQRIVKFIIGFWKEMEKVNDQDRQNVHIFDLFMHAHIPTHLLKTLQELHIGDNILTQAQVIEKLKEKTPNELEYVHLVTPGGLDYETKKIPKAKVHKNIDVCVTQAFTQQQTQELFSRYVAVLTDMDDQDHYNTLLNSITENYETGGGCWPGVRNRCAILLAHLVAQKIEDL